MTPRAVAFDLDDTLAVPDRDRAAILADAAERADAAALDGLSREAYLDAHTRVDDSRTREPIFADMLDAVDAEADPAALAAAYRDAIAAALVPVPGVEAMLDRLAETYALGVLTDGPVRAQRHKLETLGWRDRFDAVVVTGAIGTRKPDPAAFERLVARLGVPPSSVVFVGDHVDRDVRGARDAGLVPVQVLAPGAEPVDAAAAGIDLADLSDALPAVVRDLLGG